MAKVPGSAAPEIRTWIPVQLHFYQLSVFDGFLLCISLARPETGSVDQLALNSEVCQLYFHQLSVFDGNLYCLSMAILELAL